MAPKAIWQGGLLYVQNFPELMIEYTVNDYLVIYLLTKQKYWRFLQEPFINLNNIKLFQNQMLHLFLQETFSNIDGQQMKSIYIWNIFAEVQNFIRDILKGC